MRISVILSACVLAGLAGAFAKDLSQEKKAQWASQLRAVYARPETLRTMKPAAFRSLVEVLQMLGEADSSRLMALYVLSQ